MDDQILFLYAKGLTTREIVETFQEMYGAEVSASLISKVTNAAEYPDTRVQLCIVHMIRNSLKLVAWKDYRAVTQGLKEIDQSVCETEASAALDDFARTWDSKYPQISKSWRHHWDNLIPLFDYPPQIRKAIYTTNAIESLNSVIHKATKKRKLFPTDDAALKVVYLAVNQASRKWTMPIQNWKLALNRFSIEFGD